jgi:hypothetical protein
MPCQRVPSFDAARHNTHGRHAILHIPSDGIARLYAKRGAHIRRNGRLVFRCYFAKLHPVICNTYYRTCQSHMQHLAISPKHAFMHHLAQCGMREDGVHEVSFDQLCGLADGVALDQFGNLGADHMRAQ